VNFLSPERRSFLIPVALVLCLGSLLLPAQKKVNPKTLSKVHQDWLKLTDYIITTKERDVFLSLANDRERDLFIEAFWKARDPTPGTPQNEYRDEIKKRFDEANKKFSRTSAREGWMTDQGRFYIILGPPISVTDIAGGTEIWPCEIWSYYGDPSRGMPSHFSLVFYKRGGFGEPKLYDPVADGPTRLLVNAKDYSPDDPESVYDMIYEKYPELAVVCLSIVPGEIPYAYHPSPENTIYLANIIDSPKKLINESYATHFLSYKGVVSTEYLTNYIESAAYVEVVPDAITGLTFCDFAMAPEKLSVDYYEPKDQYSCNFQVDVSLRSGEKVVLQYGKEFPLSFPADGLSEAERMGVCIADSFPVVEGKYRLTVLLRNPMGKEFSVLERDIEVPLDSGQPRISGPVLGYKLVDVQPGTHLPFQAGDKKLNIDPKSTYSASDQIVFAFSILGSSAELWPGGKVEVLIRGTNSVNPVRKYLTVPLGAQTLQKRPSFVQQIPAAELGPDYYDLTLTLKDRKGQVLDERTGHFVLSPRKALGHPINAARAASLANVFLFHYMLAHQYDQLNENSKAEAAYEKAYGLNPGHKQKVPEYAEFLLKVGKFEEALRLIEAIKDDSKLIFEYYLVKGRSQMGLGRYAEAAESLTQGNRIYNSETRLLSALGYCYYKTGQFQAALNALNASLKLNPNQEDVKKLIAEIQKR
jgi:GWxTD domain-containing protein